MAKISRNLHSLIQAATNELSLEQQFVNDLKATIEKVDEKGARKPSRSYKPSSLGCIRNMYYQRTGEEIDPASSNACLVGIMQTGTDRHVRIQDAVNSMREIGIDCEFIDVKEFIRQRDIKGIKIVSQVGFETKLFYEPLALSMMCDGIIRYKGRYYVLEIKTESSYKFMNRGAIAEEHLDQGIAYSIVFGLDAVMFLYESRDNCEKKAYLLTLTDDMKYGVVSKIEECEGYVKRLIPPPKPTILSKKACTYCGYKKACKRSG